jgi:hypothetical protein
VTDERIARHPPGDAGGRETITRIGVGLKPFTGL